VSEWLVTKTMEWWVIETGTDTKGAGSPKTERRQSSEQRLLNSDNSWSTPCCGEDSWLTISCGDMYTNHNDVPKGCGVATTGNNSATDRQAAMSTVYNNATNVVEVASMVDNNSGVIHEEHGDLREQTHMWLSM
jgi:hypothetical protein